MPETIRELLDTGASDDVAISAPTGEPLTFNELRAEVDRLAGQLASAVIGTTDRVAIVLPNGPEMAITFLAVASCAASAPLNPGYREEEFRFYLGDLNARALITLDGDAEAARAATGPETQCLTLDGQAGALTLLRDGVPLEVAAPNRPSPDDIAMVLHTSGTTSRPKIVPLSQRNLAISSGNISVHLQLTPEDRCLNVMPLFHIHGLMAAVLASLNAGASVACSPGFDAFRFFEWIEEIEPTWFTAVPTMHQLILSRARGKDDLIKRHPLRFMRSSSASLPPPVMADMETLFGAPMIEAYGMTEAAHQMASNPLPPATRKPGSVGRGSNVEIAIMNDAGTLLAQGETGEVVIRGGNVTSGYESNSEANAGAFTDGWFRTGDQGYLDDEGYLFLTGRLKEIINRGGEKISPREIDEILIEHDAVVQAVAFAVPHARLGEDVAVAVVLADGAELSEGDVRAYVASRLADFKVPRKVLFVDEIPKGPTGKLQRIGLAEQLGLGA
jgi:acyl-CoA synthetase (AMP-forming)/AMP-acid ligase II